VLANDSDADGDTLHATLLAGPTHGTLRLDAAGAFTYTPDANWHGTDGFTYVADDGAVFVPAAVTITVTPVDDAPVAAADGYATTAGARLDVAAPGVLGNDTDVDGPALRALLVKGPAHGKLDLGPTGGFGYTPTPGFAGSDRFTYRATDGALTSPVTTVTITVKRVAAAPYWRGWDVVRGVMLRDDGPGGYTVDAFGGVHAWGGAPAMTTGGHYATGRAWVGGAALLGTGTAGALVDTGRGAWGFARSGAAIPRIDTRCSVGPAPTRGVAFDPASTGASAARNGVELDGWGGIRRLCGSEAINTAGAPAWPGWDIARGVALLPGGSGGFVVDGFGGIHAFGHARVLTTTGYWRGWDIARGIAIDGHGRGVVVDAWGGMHAFTYATR
jgi:VCBS repeat-containing protein